MKRFLERRDVAYSWYSLMRCKVHLFTQGGYHVSGQRVREDYVVLFKPRKYWMPYRVLWFESKDLPTLTWRAFRAEIYNMLNKPVRPKGTEGGTHSITDAKLRKLAPTVCEMMESCSYSDGSGRQTSTLTLFVDGRLLKASLVDRDNDRVLWAEDETLDGLWKALERLLGLPEPPWRWRTPEKPSGARRGRNRA